MRVFFLHILAKMVGVTFRIDGIRYGARKPLNLEDSSPTTR